MDKLLSLARKNGEQAELYTVNLNQTPVKFENNRLKSMNTQQQEITALRLVSPEGRLGFSTTTAREEPEPLLEKAREASKFGRSFDVSLPSSPPAQLPGMYHREVIEHPMEKMMEMGEDIVDAVKAQNSSALADVQVIKSDSEVSICNTAGLDTSYRKTISFVLATAQLMVGKSFLHVGKLEKSLGLVTELDELKQELVQDLYHGSREVQIPGGAYRVIFAPEAVSDLMRPLLVSLNGQSVEKQVSPFRDKQGEQMFDPRVCLTDMPHRPLSPGMCPVDDEGVITAETPLIDKGTIQTFPVDLLTAKALGVNPTGHGVRTQSKSLPSPDFHVCVLSPGQEQVSEMMQDMDRGIIIKELMGAWAGNPYSGEINGNISLGFLVEDGEIKGRIKDCMVSVNSFEALRNQLVGISKEAHWSSGDHLFPYVCLEGVHVTG